MATTVRGIARNVRWENVPTERRSMPGPLAYLQSADVVHEPHLQFRVEQVDDAGNPAEYTAVVASASSPEELPDFVSDGDEVAVTGTVDDGMLDARELTNRTTGTTVRLKRRRGLLTSLLLLVAAVISGVFLVIVTFALLNEEPGFTVAGIVIIVLALVVRKVRK